MATVNIQTNYGDIQVIEGMVQLPGGQEMPVDQYEELMMYEECMRNRSTTKPSYHYLSDNEQTRIAIEELSAKIDKLIDALAVLAAK